MNETNILNPPTDDASAYEAEIDRYIAAMHQLQKQMADDGEEIQMLQEETRVILANVMASIKAT